MVADWRHKPYTGRPYPTGRFLKGWAPLRNIANIPSVIASTLTTGPERTLSPSVVGVSGPFRKWVENVRAFDSPYMMKMQRVKTRPILKELIRNRPMLKKLFGGG